MDFLTFHAYLYKYFKISTSTTLRRIDKKKKHYLKYVPHLNLVSENSNIPKKNVNTV